ncbi:MBL fold metallo-hydrolase [Rhodococcus sp. NPDC057014]|uniref:MBL fold metallo-hydrolase n=1 Tax=Rhodococcus sp. NPDC057014 TaxID=3346000 RepID=UPI00364160E5
MMFVLRSGDLTVVVDTGGPADEEQIRRMIPFGYAVKEADRMENVLTRLGVRADDVDLVINTHLHWGHSRTTTCCATPRSWSHATN